MSSENPNFSQASSSSFSQVWSFPFPFNAMDCTEFDLIPIGGPGGDRSLESVDTNRIKFPTYKDDDFYKLVRHVGLFNFCHHLQNTNPSRLINRPETEAIWLRVVTRIYKKWDPRGEAASRKNEEKKVGKAKDGYDESVPSFLKMKLLFEAQRQRHNIKVQEYWINKATDHPGLNIETVPEPEPRRRGSDKSAKTEEEKMMDALEGMDLDEEEDDTEGMDELELQLAGIIPLGASVSEKEGDRMEE